MARNTSTKCSIYIEGLESFKAQTMDSVWVSGEEASRLAGCNHYQVLRLALLGRIRFCKMPGDYLRFHREDARQVAEDASRAKFPE